MSKKILLKSILRELVIFENALHEAPLGVFDKIGFDNNKGASFNDKRDRALINNPVTVKKVKDMLQNSSIDFDFYFVNSPNLRRFSEMGKVSKEFIFAPYPNGLGITKDIKFNRDSITVFFVTNTGTDKVPMTPWIILHRLGHVLRREYYYEEYVNHMEQNFDEILSMYEGVPREKNSRPYELLKGRMFEHIGTMRSAREKKLHLRPFEFYHEMLTQYLTQGEIKFNPLPEKLQIGSSYGRKVFIYTKNISEINDLLERLQRDAQYMIEAALGSVIGDIFVM